MKARYTVSQLLRWSAAAALALGLLVWAATGARVGWTQTSRTTMQQDEITGIDYPVQSPAFIAGVEIPLIGAAAGTFFLALSFAPRLRRRSAR